MRTIFKKYGNTIEITTIEKEPQKVRVSTSRKRKVIYGARRLDNIRRTRQICVRRVSAALEDFGSPLLVTLTFAGDSSDAAYANDSLHDFQMRLRATFAGAQSLFIPELSPRGRIHFHGLLFNVPLHLGDTRKGRRIISYGGERKSRILAELWGEGFVDAVKTDGSGRLAFYISKYITKGGNEVMFNGMKMLRISQGFPKEIIVRDEYLAEKLAVHYASTRTPINEWEGENIFLGKITRKTYNQKNEL
jgi:hypothetical protein